MACEKVVGIAFVRPADPLCIGDVAGVNPCKGTYCSCAAREGGSAAVVQGVQKCNAYRAYGPDAYDVPC